MTSYYVCKLCAIALPSDQTESHAKRHLEFRAVWRESPGVGMNVVVRIPPSSGWKPLEDEHTRSAA